MRGRIQRRPMQVLDFDMENRPLSYLGNDWTSGEITAIAWSWVGSGEIDTLLLQRDGTYEDTAGDRYSPVDTFAAFAEILESADMVTGHYIRKHDLPLMSAALLEVGLEPLDELLVQDTKEDLVRRKDFSASQKNLAAALDIAEAKYDMSQTDWRLANRLTPEGIERTRKRVIDDVIQHMALREGLLAQKLLKAPRRWKP